MMSPTRDRVEDRIFVRDGRRHYRRLYSLTEPRIGLVILCLLGLLLSWIAWKGAHPDPGIFQLNAELLEGGPGAAEVLESGSVPGSGPLPDGLAGEGWTEGTVSQFDATNLYIKINGREDYYKTFGFQRLYFVSIINDADPTVAVDIETFDLGEVANALGAYAGERSPEVIPEVGAEGMVHLDRNALFLTRGRYYIRAIGSEESPVVLEQLNRIRERIEAGIPGEPLPWAYALFTGELGIDPGRISYQAENAFSFEFGKNVYSALLDDGETELFLVSAPDESAALVLSERFHNGFLGYGRLVESAADVQWVEDRYIATIAGAVAVGSWVVGVRGAPDVKSADAALGRIRDSVAKLPDGEPES